MHELFDIGEVYYSVGVLQSNSLIEEWIYTDDKFDQRRWSLGLVFRSAAGAIAYKERMQEIL